MKKIMLLGSGELGKEVIISAQRLGCHIIAVDRYENAPGMQVADQYEVINMLDEKALKDCVDKHKPDIIVPEIEAIRTEVLLELEKGPTTIIPTARATNLTMNRDRIRDLAKSLGIRTANYTYAESLEEFKNAAKNIGIPCVVKPVMSSSGKGQSTVHSTEDIESSWEYALSGARGDRVRVIVEEFITFDYEITLLTVKQNQGPTVFCPPIGHYQERGDFQYSWQPQKMPEKALSDAGQQLIPKDLCKLLDNLVHREVKLNPEGKNALEIYRDQIDALDNELIEIFFQRINVVEEIARYKKENNVTIYQPNRWDSIVRSRIENGFSKGLSEKFIKSIFQSIHNESIEHQAQIMNEEKTKN